MSPESTRPRLSLVAPTYNEHGRLAELVESVFRVFRDHSIDGELVIVDDNSPDGTGALADELATRYRMRVVHRSGKLGLGTAVIAGFEAATGDICGVIDADLSHPPALVPRMLAAIERGDADFVIGSRYIAGGGTKDWGTGRLLMSRAACLLSRPVTPVVDATSGFFLIRRSIAEGVKIEAGGFKICLELLVRGRATAIAEIPYVFAGRTVGDSKMNLREATGYLKQLLALWQYRRAHPLKRTYSRLS